jgi:hypothetical protein
MTATDIAFLLALLVMSLLYVPAMAFLTAKAWTIGRLQGVRMFRKFHKRENSDGEGT